MLRAPLLRSRAFTAGALAPRSGSQWLIAYQKSPVRLTKRFYVDGKKADETILPGSQTTSKPGDVPPAPKLTTPVSSANPSSPPPANIPKTPPTPEEAKAAPPLNAPTPPTSVPLGTGTSQVAPPPNTPPKKKSRIRRTLLNLIILSVFGYGLGVYYALTSDNWHDFFTEYIPFGEEAVGYFEEREFRKRFMSRRHQDSRLHPQIRGEEKVTIPGRAGVSVRNADTSGTSSGKGPHVSAIEKTEHSETVNKLTADPTESKPTHSSTHQLLPKDEPKPEEKKDVAKAPTPAPEPETTKLIDNLKVDNATEPVVQDVVKILNDIIIVINADKAAGKYSSTIDKAKGDLSKVVSDIELLKQQEQKASADKLQAIHAEFDEAARELLRRQEQQIQDLEMRWREEYEAERGNLSKAYENKLQSELDSANKVYDQKVKNELLKQAIALRREFTTSVKDTVETERSGRLSKLDELSSNVQELERLTGEWNSLVDSNLRTQHLLVAVEAVRATLENSDRPTPFIEELAALKEVAADDSVVNAAIASINPTAYQRGIPSSAQLIDRFRRVSEEVRKASLLPDNAGVASHAASIVLSKVMFKKAGLPVGDDVESILTRTEVLLEEGNLEDAVREMNSLTGWAKTLSRDWLAESRKVLEVRQALDVIATEARLQSLLVD